MSPEELNELEEVKAQFLIPEPGNIGCTHLLTHTIELRDEFREQPPIRKNPYPWSPEVQRRIHTALDNMIKDDIVERSCSDWSQPVVPVAKRGSDAVRLCLDARKLNERTKRDAYPLPHQTRILSRLGSFKYLTTIDLSQAFCRSLSVLNHVHTPPFPSLEEAYISLSVYRSVWRTVRQRSAN